MGSEGGVSQSRVRHGTIKSVPAPGKRRKRSGRTTKNPGTAKANRKPQKNGYWNGYAPDGVTPLVCRHCKVNKANRPRQMCWTCYYTPGVKELYTSQCKYTRRGRGLQAGGLPLDTLICPHLPGTVEKVAFMEDRARREVQVFHPKDAKYGDGTVPDLRQISMVVDTALEAVEEAGSFSGRWAA